MNRLGAWMGGGALSAALVGAGLYLTTGAVPVMSAPPPSPASAATFTSANGGVAASFIGDGFPTVSGTASSGAASICSVSSCSNDILVAEPDPNFTDGGGAAWEMTDTHSAKFLAEVRSLPEKTGNNFRVQWDDSSVPDGGNLAPTTWMLGTNQSGSHQNGMNTDGTAFGSPALTATEFTTRSQVELAPNITTVDGGPCTAGAAVVFRADAGLGC